MVRPRIFDENRKGINIYLHKDQYDWLKKHAHKQKVSPSSFIREIIKFEMWKEKELEKELAGLPCFTEQQYKLQVSS